MPRKKLIETPARPATTHRVSVLERRLQNPFGEPSQTVRFKRPGLIGRWFNDAARPGQVHRGKELGWHPVTPDMVEDLDAIGAHDINVAGQIVRGERGQEVLMWMPEADYREIQMAKTRENRRLMGDPVRQKHEVVQAASRQLGDEGADFLDRTIAAGGGPSGYIRDGYEIIERQPEAVEE